MRTIRRVEALVLGSLALVSASSARGQDSSPGVGDSAYVAGEYRVFTGAGEPATLDEVVAAMGEVTVVFVGETHDDPTGHLIETELLKKAYETYGGPESQADGSGPRPVALSLEFFQSDVQPILDEYLADLITEKAFRADSRPWPRYQTDYRALIEFSKEKGLTVIAANAPRRYATRVTRHGRESLNELSAEALSWLAPLPYGQPSEAYREQWIQVIMEVMEQEGKKCGIPVAELADEEGELKAAAPEGSHANMGNQMHSQVLWDATMAHWISRHLDRQPDALVLHMVGGFHVERRTGTPEHLEAYRPGTRTMVVVMRPVEDIETFEPAPAGEWGDFVVQTDETHTLEAIECRRILADRETGTPRD
jgi:uncharacterized iron-regulated protein